LERFFECGGGVVLWGEGDGDCAVEAGVCGLGVASGADAASWEEIEWCTSAADGWPGVAADAEVEAVAVDGLPFGCGSEAEAEMGFTAPASVSAFSSSDNAAVVAVVISFISVISPICKETEDGRMRRLDSGPERMRARESGGGTHIIHEAFATKDVGEEARGILDVHAIFVADHLLPILVIDGS
jgi:hypothetical protein